MVSLDKMNNIIEVNAMNGDAVVQAVSSHTGSCQKHCLTGFQGVQWEALNEHLADQDIPLFFPIEYVHMLSFMCQY